MVPATRAAIPRKHDAMEKYMKRIFLAALLAGLTACSGDATGPTTPNYDGSYTLAGTVNGAPTQDLAGTLALTNQAGSQVAYTFTIAFRNNGQPILNFVTTSPGTANVSSAGAVTFLLSGPVTIGGNTYQSSWRFDGTLTSTGSLTGSWSLTTTAPSSDAGSFTAQRH